MRAGSGPGIYGVGTTILLLQMRTLRHREVTHRAKVTLRRMSQDFTWMVWWAALGHRAALMLDVVSVCSRFLCKRQNTGKLIDLPERDT